ncbi:MAG: hypothetical protein CSB33_04460 [Desulfobacterales bacterium]|nr:MAG: hypothetical protein CSB33_04460 [Desulfobacterales bacterium]
MKRLAVLSLAALLVAAFTVPAAALESQFGGYWRTRAYTMQNFTGEDQTEGMDWSGVDTRARLYYTAVFHENLKFVNKFEWDAVWGDTTLGDIGSDGKSLEIKNSYADFNLGPVNFKIGIQGVAIARGFLFDDDFSGAMVTYKGNNIEVPFLWVKAYEGYNLGYGKDNNNVDVDYYGILPIISIGESMSLNPFFLYAYSKDASSWPSTASYEKMRLFYAGLNLDVTASDIAAIWFTGIYQGGDADTIGGGCVDFAAYLLAAGLDLDFSRVNFHMQAFYATGDDDADKDMETFFVPKGQSYYWAEIMGFGIFDREVSANSPGDQIGNIMASNIGLKFKASDKLSISCDLWGAMFAEDNAAGEDYLGAEVDLKLTYKLVEGLTLDVVGAYLFTGEATYEGSDEADPYEVGTRLSLKF